MKRLIIYLCSFFLLTVNPAQADDIKEILSKYHTALNIESLLYAIVNSDDIRVIKNEVVSETAHTKTRQIILDTPGILNLGKIKFKKRDPKIKNSKIGFPTAVVLSGTDLGMNVIDFVPEVPNYSIVTVHHTIDFTVTDFSEAIKLIEDIWKLQAHYIIIYSWLQQQAEVNPYLISSVNISFGTYMVPLPLRILQAVDITPHTTVFAFGGSELMPFVDEYLMELKNDTIKTNIKKFVNPILDLFNSKKYLQYLDGPFLVINATDDSVIPIESSMSLVDGLKQSDDVDVFTLDGPHINVDKPEMIKKTIDTIFDWIRRQSIKAPFKDQYNDI